MNSVNAACERASTGWNGGAKLTLGPAPESFDGLGVPVRRGERKKGWIMHQLTRKA